MKIKLFFSTFLFAFLLQSCESLMVEREQLMMKADSLEADSLWISEVKYQAAETGTFLGSPSLLRLANGDILASHDYNGPTSNTTGVYRSTDNGHSWTHITDIVGLFWANLFEQGGNIYFLGTNAGTGVTARTIVLCRSTDLGATWSAPVTLFDTDIPGQPVRYHGAPTPVVKHNGRLYRAFEGLDTRYNWTRGYRAFVISAAENADLMTPANWKMSTKVTYNEGWDPPGSEETTGWIEGNAVIDPNGDLVNIIRVNSVPFIDKAAIIRINSTGDTATFTPDDFITFPGGLHKFVIRRDSTTGVYLAMVNNNTNASYPQQRNILSLYMSTNLRQWHHVKTLMEDDQGLSFSVSVAKTGFQYPDWQFDGDDLIYLVRTSYAGAYNYHNANRITFGRLKNFRSFITAPTDTARFGPTEIVPASSLGSVGYVRSGNYPTQEVYTTVRAGDGNVWLRQNLGADWIARSIADAQSFGNLYQWGRHTDGHQLRTSVLATPPTPNNPSGLTLLHHAPFYGGSSVWWNTGTSTDQWTASTSAGIASNKGCDPCRQLGAQWRLPTATEWQQLIVSEQISNSATAWASSLKMPKAGYRLGSNGTLYYSNGRYWSSTPHATVVGAAVAIHFTDTDINTSLALSRSGGLSIRCIRKP